MSTVALYADRHARVRLADPDDGATYGPIETHPLGGGELVTVVPGTPVYTLCSALERAASALLAHNATPGATLRGYSIAFPAGGVLAAPLGLTNTGPLVVAEAVASWPNPYHRAPVGEPEDPDYDPGTPEEPETLPVTAAALSLYDGLPLATLAPMLREWVRGHERANLAVLADATRRQAGEGLTGFGLGVQP